RYGELILYTFVEAVLKAPMVVHKISQTYNNNDQVKGADGIFIGNISGKATLLIGESKMKNNFNACVGEAMDSLKRFTKNTSIGRELEVAKNHLSRDLNNLEENDLDLIYNSFRIKQQTFKEYNLCFPAFLMYSELKIKKIIEEALPNIENDILSFLNKVRPRRLNYVKESVSDF